MTNEKKYAVLIDADNVSPDRFEKIFDEIGNFGVATYRRIYGNWAEYNRNTLKEKLLKFALTPVQQFSYINGKNATDIALVIDAMDILHEGDVDGFCLVSNDSDFSKLALRLREGGMDVIGMGDDIAPDCFRNSCTYFIVLRETRKEADARREIKKTTRRLIARTTRPATATTTDNVETATTGDVQAAPTATPDNTNTTSDSANAANTASSTGAAIETVASSAATTRGRGRGTRRSPAAPVAKDTTPVASAVSSATAGASSAAAGGLSDRDLRKQIRNILADWRSDDGWASGSNIVNQLKLIHPDLDISNYKDLPLFAGKRKIWSTYFLSLGFCDNREVRHGEFVFRLNDAGRKSLIEDGITNVNAVTSATASTAANSTNESAATVATAEQKDTGNASDSTAPATTTASAATSAAAPAATATGVPVRNTRRGGAGRSRRSTPARSVSVIGNTTPAEAAANGVITAEEKAAVWDAASANTAAWAEAEAEAKELAVQNGDATPTPVIAAKPAPAKRRGRPPKNRNNAPVDKVSSTDDKQPAVNTSDKQNTPVVAETAKTAENATTDASDASATTSATASTPASANRRRRPPRRTSNANKTAQTSAATEAPTAEAPTAE